MHTYNDNGHIYIAMQFVTNYSLEIIKEPTKFTTLQKVPFMLAILSIPIS